MLLTLLFLLLCIRLTWMIYRHRQRYKNTSIAHSKLDFNTNYRIKTLVVLGSGGHTGEMVTLLQSMDMRKFQPLFLVADTDITSKNKTMNWLSTLQGFELPLDNLFVTFPRSREVGQSYAYSIITTLYALWKSLAILQTHQPTLILCNGPGTCVPAIVGARFLEFLGILKSPVWIVFIESFCRVKSLSLTGKVVFHLTDEFIVQWPHLHQLYPRSKYFGILC